MTDPTPEEILLQGEVTLQGQFTLGSNYTFLVQAQLGQSVLQAVYKPQKGEQPLWDFPEATLANREVAAYRLSALLGLGLVPLTVFRQNGPYGAGSYQLFIPYDPNYHFFSLHDEDLPRLIPVAFFDLLCNNADRKGSHILFSSQDHTLYAIDHGLCFHAEPKLRTVIWTFAGEPIPAELLAPLQALAADPQALHAELAPLLSEEEIEALMTRAHALLREPTFPHPPQDKRAYPFPPL